MLVRDTRFLKTLYSQFCKRPVVGANARRAIRERRIVVSADDLGIFLDIINEADECLISLEWRQFHGYVHKAGPEDAALMSFNTEPSGFYDPVNHPLQDLLFDLLVKHRALVRRPDLGWYLGDQLLAELSA